MKTIIEPEQFNRTLKRMTHEIIEKNENIKDIVLVGILNKGVPIANCVSDLIYSIEGIHIPVEEINIGMHRDDDKKLPTASVTISFSSSIQGKVVILVDDVLFTGRSARAAMDALIDLGR